jgi:hypothetical protein
MAKLGERVEHETDHGTAQPNFDRGGGEDREAFFG